MSADTRTSMLMQGLADGLDTVLKETVGERVGFCLVTFPLGRQGVASYVANADRKQVADMLRDLLQRWENGMPDIPAHKKQ